MHICIYVSMYADTCMYVCMHLATSNRRSTGFPPPDELALFSVSTDSRLARTR